MLLLPKTLGPLTLQRKLGTGGVYETYQGVIDASGQRVVVRRVLPFVAQDSSRLASVEARVRDILGLKHPFLIPWIDWMEVDGERMLVEEWSDGLDLDRLIASCRAAGRPVPHNVFLNIATQVCSALEVLHGRPGKGSGSENILHLGLEPGHIFVTGEAKVLLGGFALTRSPTSLPQGGMPSATHDRLEYLSPEQTHPDQKLTPASDVFSLGAVLFELLTLEPLFRAESPLQTIHRVRRAEVSGPLQTVKDRIPGLDKVLFRALSLNPRHRYQRAFVLREDLRGLMAGYSFANIAEDTREFMNSLAQDGLRPRVEEPREDPADSTAGHLRSATRSPPVDTVPAHARTLDFGAPLQKGGAWSPGGPTADTTGGFLKPEPAPRNDWAEAEEGFGMESPTDIHLPIAPNAATDDDSSEEEPQGRQPLTDTSTAAFMARALEKPPRKKGGKKQKEKAAAAAPPPPEAPSQTLFPNDEVTGPALTDPAAVRPPPADPWGSPAIDFGEELSAPQPPAAPPPSFAPPAPPPPTFAPPAPPPPAPPPPAPAPPAPSFAAAPPPPAPPAPSFAPPPPPPVSTPTLAPMTQADEDLSAPRPFTPPPPVNRPKPAPAPPPPPPVVEDDFEEPQKSRTGLYVALGAFALLFGCAGAAGLFYVGSEMAAKSVADAVENTAPPSTLAEAGGPADEEPVAEEPALEEPAVEAPPVEEAPSEPVAEAAPVEEAPAPRPVAEVAPVRGTPLPKKGEDDWLAAPPPKPKSSPSSSSSAARTSNTAAARTTSPNISEDAVVDVGLDDPMPVTATDVDRFADPARAGKLTASDIVQLEMVESTDPSYTRSRKLLLMNAERTNDLKSQRKYLDQLLALPENTYDSVILSKDARYWVNKGSYEKALERANTAERYWARIPPDLVFATKADIYEIQASAWQGMFYRSGDDLEMLDNAVRGWEKYKEHALTKGQQDMVTRADAQIAKLEDARKRLE